MSTVAETLREDSRERLRRMRPAERLAETLRLGQAVQAEVERMLSRLPADARLLWSRLRVEAQA